jgi:hypothetical protein
LSDIVSSQVCDTLTPVTAVLIASKSPIAPASYLSQRSATGR